MFNWYQPGVIGRIVNDIERPVHGRKRPVKFPEMQIYVFNKFVVDVQQLRSFKHEFVILKVHFLH